MSNFIERSFNERLKDILEDNNLTYKTLPETSKICKRTVYCWFKYNIPPSTESIIKLARFFECPVDYFIGETEETKIKFSDNPISFSERLKSLIEGKKVTAYRACMNLHIKTDIMSVWLNKGRLPNRENLLSLMDYFKCSADYLLGLVDRK